MSVDGHGPESGAMLHLFVKISANGTEDLPVGRSPGAETGENRAGGSTNPKATGKPRRLTRVLGPEPGPTEIRSAIHGMRRGPAKKLSQREEFFIPLLFFYCHHYQRAYHKNHFLLDAVKEIVLHCDSSR